MNRGLLRRAWPSIGLGIALGCCAAFAGSWVFTLLLFSLSMITGLMSGASFAFTAYEWSFILMGVVMSSTAAVVPGSLGGGAIGLALHILAPRSASLAKLGVLVGCFAGGLAGVVSVLVARLLFGWLPAWMALSVIGIAVLAGGWVGRWLASHESARIARSAGQ